MIEWRDVVGFEDDYEVSSDGQVRSKDRERRYVNSKTGKTYTAHFKGRPKKPLDSWDGYLETHLQRTEMGVSKNYYARIHRLVAEAFIPNPENKPQVNHKDGNKKNNVVSNLEWVTEAENTQHAISVLHGHWQHRNGSCTDVRVKCLNTGQWFSTEKEAAISIDGDVAAFNVMLLKHRPYKGYMFMTESDLKNLSESEESYLQRIMTTYRGKGWSFRYQIECSDGHSFSSLTRFCKFYQISEFTVRRLFEKSDTIVIDGMTVIRTKMTNQIVYLENSVKIDDRNCTSYS